MGSAKKSPGGRGAQGTSARAGAGSAKQAGTGGSRSTTASQPQVPRPPVQDDGSRGLAALGYGFLILLAAITLRLEYLTPQGEAKVYNFSAIETAAIAILDVFPALTPATQLLLFPSTWLRRLSMVIKYCRDGRKEMCDLGSLWDVEGVLAESDLTAQVPLFHQLFSPPVLNMLYIGGVITTFTAIAGIYRPVKTGVFGLILLAAACYMTPAASFLPTLLMEAFLGAYVLLYNQEALEKDKEERERKAKARVEAAAKRLDERRGARGAPPGVVPAAAVAPSGSVVKDAKVDSEVNP